MNRPCPRAASVRSDPGDARAVRGTTVAARARMRVPLAPLILTGLVALLLPAAAHAQSSNLQIWQKTIKRAPPSRPGCFEVAYPDIQWRSVSCAQTQSRSRTAFPPLSPLTADAKTAGSANYAATVWDKGIAYAEGYFIDTAGVNHIYSEDSKGNNPRDNLFTLRLNTNFFPLKDSGLCAGRSSACQGGVQFLYDNDNPQGDVYIRYWILGGAACPASWQSHLPVGCYKTSAKSPLPGLSADDLGDAALSGQSAHGLDVAIVSVNSKAYAQVSTSVFKNLPQLWRQAGFDLSGHDAYYAILNINPGASLTVRTTVDNGTAAAPICSSGAPIGGAGPPDGKSGNLQVNSPCCPYGGAEPSIAFLQGSAGQTATCAALGNNTIVPAAGAHGSISPTASFNVPDGAVSMFTVMPDAGYHIASVTGCGGTLSGNVFTTAPATASCAIAATFSPEPYPAVSTEADAGGIIAPSGYVSVDAGASTAFAITPDASHIIAAVDGTCAGELSGNTYTTQAITDNCTVKVTFAQQINVISASAGMGGTIYPAGYSAATSGTVRTFTITPYSRFAIDSVGGTCGGTLSGNTFTTLPITESCTITPQFVPAARPHTVSPSATGNAGGIAIESWRPVSVPPGSSVSFRFTAKQGYQPAATVNTCGAGEMSGVWPHYTYTTGPVTTNCSVRFTAARLSS